MCGRYGFFVPINEAATWLEVSVAPNEGWQSRYNAAPTQAMPIITNEFPDVMQFYRWGLVPAWAKDPSAGSKMINTRMESIAEKPAFRNIFKYRRCIVPASGYYEWKAGIHAKSPGQPYFISSPDMPVLLMAGLWSHWGQQGLQTYSIITAPANEDTNDVHDRMPVLFTREEAQRWLQPLPAEELMPMLGTPLSGRLKKMAVQPLVNKVRNEGPELLTPAKQVTIQGTLF